MKVKVEERGLKRLSRPWKKRTSESHEMGDAREEEKRIVWESFNQTSASAYHSLLPRGNGGWRPVWLSPAEREG